MRYVILLAFPCLLSAQELAFRQLSSAGAAPTARVDGVIVYDERMRRLLLFGGRDTSPRNDLWSYSLERGEWSELRPSGSAPPPRFGHTVVFDAQRRRLVIFGGQAGGFFSDTWSYDIDRNQWSQLAADNAGPSRRYGHSAILDAARERMIISHGFTNSGRFDDTWAFNLSTNRWQDISPSSGRPLRRCLHHAVLDAEGQQMLLYGGCASGSGPCPLGDLWSFDLNTHRWTERVAALKPSPRQWHGLGFDAMRRRMILFGGSGDAGALNDAWEYDPAAQTWMQLRTAASPSSRDRHETTFVPNLGVIFFGGQTGFNAVNELLVLGAPQPAPQFEFEGPVAPGQLITMNGSALGPHAGEVRVAFNGINVPILSAQAEQIVLQAPYEIAGLLETDVIVTVGAQSSSPVRVRVAATNPQILSATRGDTIEVIATGLGILAPSTEGVPPAPAAPLRIVLDASETEILSIAADTALPGVFRIHVRNAERVASLSLYAGDASTTFAFQ